MSAAANDPPESGQLPGRFEYAVETERGVPPSDPDYQPFSDSIRSFEADPGATVERQDEMANPDAVGHNRGPEDPSASIGYDLQQFPVNINFEDPEITSVGSTILGVQSTDASDTGIDVTIWNNDESQSETISTDGTDGTTFVSGSESFDSIGKVVLSGAATGDIEVLEDDGGSAGYLFGSVPIGDTETEDITPNDASGYGIDRDQYNRIPASLTLVNRRRYPGGNDSAGAREYTVVLGALVTSASPDLDPSSAQPILMSLDLQPTKVRSYLIHQLSSQETLSISSTESSADSGISATIENDDASTSETISMGQTGGTNFGGNVSIDSIWLDGQPEGDVTIEGSSSGTTVMELDGALTYSDDSQPVDGDQGVPSLGSGSHASEIGTSFEHFIGDSFERPAGSSVRPRIISASWTIENEVETTNINTTRAPVVDEGNRTTTIEADVGGQFVSHRSMMQSLTLDQNNIEHELSGGIMIFPNAVPTDAATRTIEEDQIAYSESETFECSGTPFVRFRRAT